MGTLMVDFFVTLDGYAGAKDSPAYFGLDGPGMFDWVNEQLERDHIMVMGANTYRALSGMAVGDDPSSARVAELEKIVFSSTIEPPLAWANSRLVRDDAATAIADLKRRERRPMRTIGSLSLTRSLIRAGVVDRLRLMVFPLILGTSGRERIFDGLPDIDLSMVGSRTLDGRLQLLEYVPTPRA